MIPLKIKLQCLSWVSKLKKFQRLSMIPRYNKFTKVQIRVCPIENSNSYRKRVVDRRGQHFRDFTASPRIMFTVGSIDRLSSESRPTIDRYIDRTDRSTLPTVNMIPIVKGTSWNLRDLTSHRQGVFDKKRKKLNSSSARQKSPTRNL